MHIKVNNNSLYKIIFNILNNNINHKPLNMYYI